MVYVLCIQCIQLNAYVLGQLIIAIAPSPCIMRGSMTDIMYSSGFIYDRCFKILGVVGIEHYRDILCLWLVGRGLNLVG
jgi:hypothetical protein